MNVVIGGGTHMKASRKKLGLFQKTAVQSSCFTKPKVLFLKHFPVSSTRLGYVLLADSYVSTPGKMSSIPELLEF